MFFRFDECGKLIFFTKGPLCQNLHPKQEDANGLRKSKPKKQAASRSKSGAAASN
jgi:hypothetical protein